MKLSLLLLLVFTGSAFGQLAWETTEQTFNCKPEDKEVVAKYKFTNAGTKAIKIENVRTSCGCTTAALNKTDYAPGESGEIDAKFTFAGRTGPQQKEIMVTTSAVPENPTVLKLRVNIKEMVKVEPEVVFWNVGEQPAPRFIHIAIAEDAAAKVVSVTSDNPALKVTLTELKPGREYEAQVTPENATKPETATLMIQTDYPPGNPETKYAYARVK
ncbi:MAG: DUF1573 domain-containing protein [Verrucomicrobia bacterium]|nr:DUF1573 domain-containing protein [Verrucomicrobiota bacterium]MBV8377667.1 DUF1573 domain-containing protein [Verrucomicrobiota bacterium]